MSEDRLRRQIDFILEIDRAKSILRQNSLGDGSRRENDAEHAWHLAMMAVVLAEHAAEPVDVFRVVVMLLVHDIVEIDAGDTYVYDDEAQASKEQRERDAADRLYAMLPGEQGKALREAWEEFEARRTPEARFAAALDRLQPILLNYLSRGGVWRKHGITARRVHEYNRHMTEGAPALWEFASRVLADAVERGYLPE